MMQGTGVFARALVAAALIACMLQRGGTERGVTAAPAAQTIVAIGDSIVYGLHDAGGAGGWAGRLGSILGQTYPGQQYRVINAGINGDTSAGVLKRLSRDVIGKNPDLVIVAIGTNDFDYNIPVATFRANLTAILIRLRRETHAAIVAQSFLPEVRVRDDVLRREASYNAVVPQVCRQLGVGYQDLFDTFLALGRSAMTSLRHDSEHPTPAGYMYIAAETGAFIQSVYAAADGSLIQARHAPGTDKLLPDDSLDGTSGS